ncbi:MAG TPA: hypothetical protein VHU81_00125 [Thermoanaerobaculia bacterium]|nr:hypothetical protein [Thermoanaerobaculia bacterium]
MDQNARLLLAKMIWPKDNQTPRPDLRAARDLLRGTLVRGEDYGDTWPKDKNRDLNRWAALKVAFAGLDVPWIDDLTPTNGGYGNWLWREKQGPKRAPGSQNIPCHENATKLYMAVRRGKPQAVRALLQWWQGWGDLMQRKWMGDELLSREYGPTVTEAVHAVLEAFEKQGAALTGPDPGLAAEVRGLLDGYLNDWYFENALRAVPWVKADMRQGPPSGRSDLDLSIVVAGMRSAPSFSLAYQAEPLLALMLDWPLVGKPQLSSDPHAWSDYPVDDRVAIPALSSWRPKASVLACAAARLDPAGADTPQFFDASICRRKQGDEPVTVTGYHTARLADGGLVSWIDEDTNHETVPTSIYAVSRDGQVRLVQPVKSDENGPNKGHRKVPRSTVEARLDDAGRLTLTVLQFPTGGGDPQVFAEEVFEGVRTIDGRADREGHGIPA